MLVREAPVSGGVAGAEAGTLTIMCGGEAEVLEKARPVLETMGSTIRLVGGMGAGKDLKAVNNLIAAVNTVVAAEGLMLARAMGLDENIAYDVIKASSGQSYNFDNRFLRMANQDFDGGFKLWLMMKDMRIALASGADAAMPVSTLAYQLYQMADKTDKDADFSAVVKVLQRGQED